MALEIVPRKRRFVVKTHQLVEAFALVEVEFPFGEEHIHRNFRDRSTVRLLDAWNGDKLGEPDVISVEEEKAQ